MTQLDNAVKNEQEKGPSGADSSLERDKMEEEKEEIIKIVEENAEKE